MKKHPASALFAVVLGFGVAGAVQAEDSQSPLKDRAIGFAMTNKSYAIYHTPDRKAECPKGLNNQWGPRERFSALYPETATPRSFVDTALAGENEIWFPETGPATGEEEYPFHVIEGAVATGLDLDGKVGPEDFTSPEGVKGIDNQFYRAVGCTVRYGRGGGGGGGDIQNYNFNRILIELTEVDDLTNDDHVVLTTYRGLDSLIQNAAASGFLPRGTQRLDLRWGKKFIQRFNGKIVDGVLETEATDLTLPAGSVWEEFSVHHYRNLRWRLKVTPESAEGMMAGYMNVDEWYRHMNRTISTHHHSYQQMWPPALYRALRRAADAYPDPVTGENTAVSIAMTVKLQQAFIVRPAKNMAANGEPPRETPSRVATSAER